MSGEANGADIPPEALLNPPRPVPVVMIDDIDHVELSPDKNSVTIFFKSRNGVWALAHATKNIIPLIKVLGEIAETLRSNGVNVGDAQLKKVITPTKSKLIVP